MWDNSPAHLEKGMELDVVFMGGGDEKIGIGIDAFKLKS